MKKRFHDMKPGDLFLLPNPLAPESKSTCMKLRNFKGAVNLDQYNHINMVYFDPDTEYETIEGKQLALVDSFRKVPS